MNKFIVFILVQIVNSKDVCISPIDYMHPPICSRNIDIIGEKKTYEYAKILFGDIQDVMNITQKKCILNNGYVSQNIKNCIKDLTINNLTIPFKVAQGLALDQNNNWVSACAENMPCIDFNQMIYNGTFEKLIKKCNAEEQFKVLFNNTHFIESSWYGFKYCQHLYPKKCLYLERESCSNIDYLYACPVSKWIYAGNFMLFYILDPLIASRMPGCRIIY